MSIRSDLFLKFLVNKGIHEKLIGKIDPQELKDVYIPRARMEMDIFTEVGISDYFLILWGIYRFCRENNIPTGSGRGSAAGCLVSYLIGITQVNPLEFDLIFERFYNAGRAETRQLPDIDFDVSQEHRDRIINEYLIPTYGERYIAPIGTFGKIQAKSAVKDVGRVLRVPLEDTNRISKLIPEKRGVVGTLAEALEEKDADGNPTQNAQYLMQMRVKYPELFKWVPIIDEMNAVKTESVHAAGIIVSPQPIGDYVPLRWNASKKLACTMYDMYELENTGALKLDLLGLRNLDIINNTLQRTDMNVKYHDFLEKVDFNDEAAWNLLRAGKCIGVFQFESPFMRQITKDVSPDSVEDLSAINALGRPGPLDAHFDINMSDVNCEVEGELPPFLKRKAKTTSDGETKQINMIEVYIARKKGELKTVYDHPMLEPILNNTYGVIVYQEQVMRIATDLAGFSLSEADVLRKIMGKKQVAKMPGQHDKFIEGCQKNDIPEAVAERIWDQIATFAQYGFNKCLAKGTRVHTKRGTIPIEEVQVGDYVLSTNYGARISMSTRNEWRKVKDVLANGKKPCLKLMTNHRFQHVATPGHKVVTTNGFKRMCDLVPGDEVIVCRNLPSIKIESKYTPVEAILYALSMVNETPHDIEHGWNFALKREDLTQLAAEALTATGITDVEPVYQHSATWRTHGTEHVPWAQKYEGIRDTVEKRDRWFRHSDFDQTSLSCFLGAFVSATAIFNQGRFMLSTPSERVAKEIQEAFSRFGILTRTIQSVSSGYDNYRIFLVGRKSVHNFNAFIYSRTTSEFKKGYDEYMDAAGLRHKTGDDNPDIFVDEVRYVHEYDEVETYDIEVEGDSEEDHVFFGDNILTHNSHSVSYSILAYITAYMKTHYPAEFMASLISSDKDINKRSVWISDAKDVMNLLVQPPNINKSGTDFIAHGREIVFGLKEVKGVGTNAVKAILRERKRGGEFASMQDFYERVDLNQVNAARFRALAAAGAFSELHENRAELIEWDTIIRERRQKSSQKLKLRTANVEKFSELLEQASKVDPENATDFVNENANKVQQRQIEEGKKTIKEIYDKIVEKAEKALEKNKSELVELEDGNFFYDLPEVPAMTLEQVITREAELLGIQISGTLATPYQNEIMMYSQLTVGDLLDEENQPDWVDQFCGVFTDLNITQVKTGPNKGKKMAIGTFVDLTGKIKALIFSKTYEEAKDILMEGKPFIVTGKLSEQGDALICMKIKEC